MSKQYQNLLAGKLYKTDKKIQSMKEKGRYLSRLFNETTEKDKSDWEAMYEAYQASIE